jgi:hypothetical protein
MRFNLISFVKSKLFTNANTNNVNKQLGRWCLKYDENSISKTVLLANEDNCGCCQEKQQPKIHDYDTNYIDEYILINIHTMQNKEK